MFFKVEIKLNFLYFRIAYAALYNVSIYSIASPQLINCELVNLLNNDIQDVDNTNVEPDLRLFALKLLQSLIRNICTKAEFNIIYYNVSTINIGVVIFQQHLILRITFMLRTGAFKC